jgi:hypothetical protein
MYRYCTRHFTVRSTHSVAGVSTVHIERSIVSQARWDVRRAVSTPRQSRIARARCEHHLRTIRIAVSGHTIDRVTVCVHSGRTGLAHPDIKRAELRKTIKATAMRSAARMVQYTDRKHAYPGVGPSGAMGFPYGVCSHGLLRASLVAACCLRTWEKFKASQLSGPGRAGPRSLGVCSGDLGSPGPPLLRPRERQTSPMAESEGIPP